MLFSVFLLSYAVYEVQGWYKKMKDLMKSRKNLTNITTISGAIPMDDLGHLKKTIQISENSHPEPSTSKCAVNTQTTLKSIDSVLPGQIPSSDTPENIMDPKPSTSTNATQTSTSNEITSEVHHQPSNSHVPSNSLKSVRLRGQKSASTVAASSSPSILPSTIDSTVTTPSGK